MGIDIHATKMLPVLEYEVCARTGEQLFHIEIRNAVVDKETEMLVYPSEEMIDKTVFNALAYYPSRLRGRHVQYIREQMRFSRYDFAKKLDVLCSDVAEWETENEGWRIPLKNYTWLLEFSVRLCADALWQDNGDFKRLWDLIDELRKKRGKLSYLLIVIDAAECEVTYESE